MTYKGMPSPITQIAMGVGIAGRIYPLLDATRFAAVGHTMGSPVESTSGMRIYRPPVCGTFNAEATAIRFYRPSVGTHYYFNIDRIGDTLGMECQGDKTYGPIALHPDVEYVSFYCQVGTENVTGGWAVPGVHNSLTF